MSYAAAAVLQSAVYSRLVEDLAVADLSDGKIYDALPPGPVPTLYVSIGPERVKDRSDKTGGAAIHDFPITVVSTAVGFQKAKALGAAISNALVGADLSLAGASLLHLNFLRAVARRNGNGREIEIWFRALVDTGAT